jgi:RNA polymerase sigma-70 factor, ECF subfamily
MTGSETPVDAPPAADGERRLVKALRAGDEAAFAALVERYHRPLFRLAEVYVRDRAVAEEVVQETWLGVISGIDRFEGRSSVKTWIFRILTNRAKTRAVREGRTIPFSSLDDAGDESDGRLEPEHFVPAGDRYAGHWTAYPRPWTPEDALLGAETRALVGEAIAALPPAQRAVITMRDVEGLDASEVCDVLGVSEGNQRVLLHRARTRVRRALDRYLAE